MTEWEELKRSPVTKSNDPMVIALVKAISNQQTIEIIYDGGSKPGDTRTIRPQAVYTVEGSDLFYLDAYCQTRQETRCFRVDKIVIPERLVDRPARHTGSKDSIDQAILRIVNANPGQKSKEIATRLGIDRRIVNSVLYGRLKGKVRADKRYRWYPKGTSGTKTSHDKTPPLDTPLARLCRYYLDCLNHDDLGGVSTFAVSKYGDPDYVELATLPMLDEDATNPFDTDEGQKLLGRIRRDRYRKSIFLGYPVRLRWHRSAKGWEGYFVEPLLLLPFEEPRSRYDVPTLSDDLPQINFRALRALSNAGETSLMEEAIQLAEELGLGNAGDDQPNLDEILSRLCGIRSDWDWKEEIDPYALSGGPPLSDLGEQGIYNRAVLIAAERSPYTKGLESELGMLQLVEEGKYRGTALGSWLNSQTIESPPANQQPLLEVLPLNSEQRQAVRQALSNPLTVITGPPGTGKSQVVMSILVNAAWQGKTVLFASKNNKAVDVVETRVNAIGSRPVLLRLGTNQYQTRLAEYLVSLLAATATADDHARHREFEAIHAHLQHRSDALDAELQMLVDLRNEVDRLEQAAEQIRQEVGNESFCFFRKISPEKLKRAAAALQAAIDRANNAKQPFLTRLVWPLVRQGRFAQLEEEASAFQKTSQYIVLPVPEEGTIDEWVQYGSQLASRVSQVAAARQYFGRLAALTEAPCLEELSRGRKKLTEDLAANSEALWQAWLRLQPSRMGPEQRKLLGDYSALLQMIVSANDQNRRLGRDVFRRYYQLFPQITSILSCWAVTSLSARGRVPFDPNFFDVLVVDEASQCDIASALPLLYRASRVVVIGDPMQLRHISTLSEQQDQQLLGKHGLVDDHPGWAYSVKSLFDLASSLCRSEDIVALRDHHRSHADIIEFSNKVFYEGRLRVATNYDRLRFPRQGDPAVRWVDVQGKTVRPGSGGAVNEAEAQAVVEEIGRLIGQGYRGSIGVVSPFRAQANRIRDLVFQRDDLVARLADADFLSDAVHKFQGDERDVMFFSPTVSRDTPRGALWFLRNYPNLFNVAITRARAALIVVGNKGAALNCNVDYLARFAKYVGQLDSPEESTDRELPEYGKEYPAVSRPELVSDWEKVLYRALFAAGVGTIPQYAVEKYLLDLALLTDGRMLDIEVDGERYHRNWDGELCRRDQIRNQRLMELGWDVMRFWVYQVRDDLDGCVERVLDWLKR